MGRVICGGVERRERTRNIQVKLNPKVFDYFAWPYLRVVRSALLDISCWFAGVVRLALGEPEFLEDSERMMDVNP